MSRNESSCPTAQGRLLNLSSIATCKLSSWNWIDGDTGNTLVPSLSHLHFVNFHSLQHFKEHLPCGSARTRRQKYNSLELASREPKSDAKLQPISDMAKYFFLNQKKKCISTKSYSEKLVYWVLLLLVWMAIKCQSLSVWYDSLLLWDIAAQSQWVG